MGWMYGLLASHLRERQKARLTYQVQDEHAITGLTSLPCLNGNFLFLAGCNRVGRASPVVIGVIPVVKVNQEALVHHVGYRGYADERGIHTVDRL